MHQETDLHIPFHETLNKTFQGNGVFLESNFAIVHKGVSLQKDLARLLLSQSNVPIFSPFLRHRRLLGVERESALGVGSCLVNLQLLEEVTDNLHTDGFNL